MIQSSEGESLRVRLRQRIAEFKSKIENRKSKISSAIIPLILGDEATAIAAATKLREQNIFVPAIRYPTVARGAARLRVTLTAEHSADDIAELRRTLERWLPAGVFENQIETRRQDAGAPGISPSLT